MTDTLLQKLEEKMMVLLTELETLRKETHRLKQENITLKTEQVDHSRKLQDLIALLDSLETSKVASVVAADVNYAVEYA